MPDTAVVRIRSLTEARSVLAAAAGLDLSLTLISPAGAAGSAGPGWWMELLAALAEPPSEWTGPAILDCGDCAGDAMAALRAGVPLLSIRTEVRLFERLTGMATACGARICSPPDNILIPRGGRLSEFLIRHAVQSEPGRDTVTLQRNRV